MKSYRSQNPIKRKDMNLKILGRMALDIISIIAHNPYENKQIILTKNHQPSKCEKGKLVGRLLRDKC